MKCTVKTCHRPALFDCDACGEDCCALHSKACDECGKLYCSSVDGTCFSAHECAPPKKQPEKLETMGERYARMGRAN